MDKRKIGEIGDRLYLCLQQKKTIRPLTESYPDISIEDAYQISLHIMEQRVQAGAKVIGKKIGVTSHAVQSMLGVFQPDFGFLTDDMQYYDDCVMPVSKKLIQPRAEGEIAFRLKKPLSGPGITEKDVLEATDYVCPCFEIVDSRIENWEIKIQDTIADNASCGLFALGDRKVRPEGLDFETCGMVVRKNGEIISTGAGAAVQGSPLTAVAWLANTLGKFGVPLNSGDLILSGSLVPLEPVKSGDHIELSIGSGIGNCKVAFS